MNWTVYWFMFPACIVISSIAMLSGISGAAMLSPTIILVFPLQYGGGTVRLATPRSLNRGTS